MEVEGNKVKLMYKSFIKKKCMSFVETTQKKERMSFVKTEKVIFSMYGSCLSHFLPQCQMALTTKNENYSLKKIPLIFLIHRKNTYYPFNYRKNCFYFKSYFINV